MADQGSLLCTETNLCFDNFEAPDGQSHQMDSMDDFMPLQSNEVLCTLLEKEIDFLPRDDFIQRFNDGELDVCEREDAIAWICKARGQYEYGGLSVCLAINYLDRFLSVSEPPSELDCWSMQWLAVACYSLATKIDGVDVPLIVHLQVPHPDYPDYVFEAKKLRNLELLVLSRLKWRMQACTPCTFIDYHLRKVNNIDTFPSESMISRSIELFYRVMKDVDFSEFRPSEISAAVAIFVTRETRELDIDTAVSSIIHVEKDRVLKCVEMIEGVTAESDYEYSSVTLSELSDAFSPGEELQACSPSGVLDLCLSFTSSDEDSFEIPSVQSSPQTSQDSA